MPVRHHSHKTSSRVLTSIPDLLVVGRRDPGWKEVFARDNQTLAVTSLVTERNPFPMRYSAFVQTPEPKVVSISNTVEVNVAKKKSLGVPGEVGGSVQKLGLSDRLVEPGGDSNVVRSLGGQLTIYLWFLRRRLRQDANLLLVQEEVLNSRDQQ